MLKGKPRDIQQYYVWIFKWPSHTKAHLLWVYARTSYSFTL